MLIELDPTIHCIIFYQNYNKFPKFVWVSNMTFFDVGFINKIFVSGFWISFFAFFSETKKSWTLKISANDSCFSEYFLVCCWLKPLYWSLLYETAVSQVFLLLLHTSSHFIPTLNHHHYPIPTHTNIILITIHNKYSH